MQYVAPNGLRRMSKRPTTEKTLTDGLTSFAAASAPLPLVPSLFLLFPLFLSARWPTPPHTPLVPCSLRFALVGFFLLFQYSISPTTNDDAHARDIRPANIAPGSRARHCAVRFPFSFFLQSSLSTPPTSPPCLGALFLFTRYIAAESQRPLLPFWWHCLDVRHPPFLVHPPRFTTRPLIKSRPIISKRPISAFPTPPPFGACGAGRGCLARKDQHEIVSDKALGPVFFLPGFFLL